MKVSVRLFAAAGQLAGCDLIELDLPEQATIGLLREELAASVPKLRELVPRIMFAVDAEYVSDTTPIRGGTEVAAIPPVSGG